MHFKKPRESAGVVDFRTQSLKLKKSKEKHWTVMKIVEMDCEDGE